MKRKLMLFNLLVAWFCFAVLIPASLAVPMFQFHSRRAFQGSDPSYLIFQNFEGTGYDNGETWVETGVVNPDWTTNVYTGTEACNFTGTYVYARASFAPQTNVWAFARHRAGTHSSSSPVIFGLQDDPATVVLTGLIIDGLSGVALRTNSQSAFSTYTLSHGTWYNVLLHYVAGSTCSLWLWPSVDGPTKPTVDGTGGAVLTRAAGVSTSAGIVMIGRGNSGTNLTFDDVRVNTTEITP